ncbi:MAG TPA: hypothetical protein VK190_02685 [Pseudoneobacillus sp.]|jgi:hypothetical protein|nr:hypothetical protein [Pseudoneobacillus sp.]
MTDLKEENNYLKMFLAIALNKLGGSMIVDIFDTLNYDRTKDSSDISVDNNGKIIKIEIINK